MKKMETVVFYRYAIAKKCWDKSFKKMYGFRDILYNLSLFAVQ